MTCKTTRAAADCTKNLRSHLQYVMSPLIHDDQTFQSFLSQLKARFLLSQTGKGQIVNARPFCPNSTASWMIDFLIVCMPITNDIVRIVCVDTKA